MAGAGGSSSTAAGSVLAFSMGSWKRTVFLADDEERRDGWVAVAGVGGTIVAPPRVRVMASAKHQAAACHELKLACMQAPSIM